MGPDLLSTICREIDERMSELRPRLAEYEQLLVAAEALVATSATIVAEAIPETLPESKVLASAKPTRRRVSSARKAAPRAVPEKPTPAERMPAEPRTARAARGAARETILAALDHGSHTVGELAIVTAMSGPNINGNLRRLEAEGAVVKIEREGKTAYALSTA